MFNPLFYERNKDHERLQTSTEKLLKWIGKLPRESGKLSEKKMSFTVNLVDSAADVLYSPERTFIKIKSNLEITW